MRAAILVLLLTPFLSAEEGKLHELVRQLGADDPGLRDEAARKIFALGEGSIPALEELRPEDPEVARAVRALVRRTKTVKLQIIAPSGVQHIGAPLKFEVHLINNTDESLFVGLTKSSRAGRGTKSAFMVQVKGKPALRLRPDQVEVVEPQARNIVLQPEDVLRVRITLAGKDSPLRRPGDIELSALFSGFLGHATFGQGNRITEVSPVVDAKVLETTRITILARGRKPAELDAALHSRDRKVFQSALDELALREDAEVLSVLRRHIDNPFLRERAISRIGAAAKDDDLDLLRTVAATEGERIEVRVAAVVGLGNYDHRKARSRLMLLAHSARLRNAAVHALVKHKRAATIDCFVRLLQRRYHEGEWTKVALGAILLWTDKHVSNHASEIDAFERWWRENRQEWLKANK